MRGGDLLHINKKLLEYYSKCIAELGSDKQFTLITNDKEFRDALVLKNQQINLTNFEGKDPISDFMFMVNTKNLICSYSILYGQEFLETKIKFIYLYLKMITFLKKINAKSSEKVYITAMRKKALITGVTGQDGSYLAELLLKKVIKFMVLKGELHLSILRELIIFMKTGMRVLTFSTLW